MSLEATEKECAEGRTAPRVSLADIQAAIVERHTFTASAACAAMKIIFGDSHTEIACHSALSVLTICILVLKNGFTVIGKSAPASPENFDAKLGAKLAYDDCIRQIWPLMGFALREKLSVL